VIDHALYTLGAKSCNHIRIIKDLFLSYVSVPTANIKPNAFYFIQLIVSLRRGRAGGAPAAKRPSGFQGNVGKDSADKTG